MKLLNYILPVAFVSACLMAGCINDNYPVEGDDDLLIGSQTYLMLHIQPLNTPASRADDNRSEDIKSLRVVMIDDKTDIIEINEKINTGLEALFSETGYYYRTAATAGKKRFYIFANEESVTNINGAEGQSLTALFSKESYNPVKLTDDSTPSSGNGVVFEQEINGVWFKSQYEFEGDKIYLPYSTYYAIELEAGEMYEEPMFLVPAAIKFDVHLYNYRQEQVRINSVAIESTADRCFLMGNVGTKDYTKDGDYWVDWLKKVSDDSHDYPGYDENVGFNNVRGWILDYALPLQTLHQPLFLFSNNSNPTQTDADMTVDELKDDNQPGYKHLQTTYTHESRAMADQQGYQQYYLQIKLYDSSIKQYITLSQHLPNVKALFRNTHVIINVTMKAGDMDIYAEIIPWTVDATVNGFVTEEN